MHVIYRTKIYTQPWIATHIRAKCSSQHFSSAQTHGCRQQVGMALWLSICLACHVYTSSCHKCDEVFSTAVLCFWSISNEFCDSERCLFVNRRARLHKQLWLRPIVTVPLQFRPDPWLSATRTKPIYPFHSMTGGHNSVMGICLACHVYAFSCHNCAETFSTVVLCLWLISNAYMRFREMSLSSWMGKFTRTNVV